MNKVLIVDDDRTICRCLQKLIDWEKINCLPPVIAYDGLTALERVKEEKPDIIIADLRMPIMNGTAFCEEVHRLYDDVDMIFFSAYEDFQAAKAAIRYGVSDYILKPINRESLESIQKIIINIQERNNPQVKRLRVDTAAEHEPQKKDANDILVDTIKSIVAKSFGDPNLSVEGIAGQVGFSADYLGKLFVNRTGSTIYSYILDYRLQVAVELLTNSGDSVTEIARKVGYVYSNYFAKVFRDKLGMTPSQYRHKYYREKIKKDFVKGGSNEED